jgi:hypothetical protein
MMRPSHKHVRFVDGVLVAGMFTRELDGKLQAFGDMFEMETAANNRFRVEFDPNDDVADFFGLTEPSLVATFERIGPLHSVLCDLQTVPYPQFYDPSYLTFGDLFDYDYAAMRNANAGFRGELLAHVMHPNNVAMLPGIGLIN